MLSGEDEEGDADMPVEHTRSARCAAKVAPSPARRRAILCHRGRLRIAWRTLPCSCCHAQHVGTSPAKSHANVSQGLARDWHVQDSVIGPTLTASPDHRPTSRGNQHASSWPLNTTQRCSAAPSWP
eukprot:352223-Chlamydomonas_euryale.AAC.5